MSTQTTVHYDIVSRLPSESSVTFRNVAWEDYADLIEQVGEAGHLRISYEAGTLTAMTLSPEHENYARLIEKLIGLLSVRLRLNIRSFGSATIRKEKLQKGLEPDACFYIQTADLIGNRLLLDFEKDPLPDVAVEIDIHHDTTEKLRIYTVLGVQEVWRFDGKSITIHVLDETSYQRSGTSHALPMLTDAVLSEALNRLSSEGELAALLAFDKWLQAQM
jgi:Uma2 family endonuclease